MSFAARVKILKKQKGLTNDKLSAMTDIPLGTLSKILAGVTGDPKLSAAAAIADALNTSLDFLCNGKADAPPSLSLSLNETILIKKYRALDEHGREICDFIISKEYDRIIGMSEFEESLSATRNPAAIKSPQIPAVKKPSVAAKAPAPSTHTAEPSRYKKNIPLFHLPVAAGDGIYLDGDDHDTITVTLNERTADADFALQVKGDSMLPLYSDGDTLLVRRQDTVPVGELGIFIADGEGYFKKFGGDRLISLNPEYKDLPLSAFSSVLCQGQVIGRLKRRG